MIASLSIFDVAFLRSMVIPLAVGFMVLEYLISRLTDHHHETHDLTESAASAAVWIGQAIIRVTEAGLIAIPFGFAYNHRLFDIPVYAPASLATLFVANEFIYYWHHRASHRIRWLWATHSVHHSATRLNLTAAIRLGWTGNISGNFLFFLPLAWIGFHPYAILGMLAANLGYQFFIHTEFAPRLGVLEWILNTPNHHRVHHASNAACLDRNYGGVLIIFDRLFGTFAEVPDHEALRYGLVGGQPTLNPIQIALGEWRKMFADASSAPTLALKLRALFAPPGSMSTPAGPSATAERTMPQTRPRTTEG